MPAEMQKSRRYLSIQDGKMIERNGEIENVFNTLSGVWLVDMSFQKVEKDGNEVGELLLLHLTDDSDYWVLKMWGNGNYARSFYQMMQNIDWEFPITFSTKMKVENGKKRHSLFMSQDGLPLKWCYTKDNMQDCPPIEWMQQADGSQKIDDSLQQMFFIIKVENWLVPQLQKQPNRFPGHSNSSAFFTSITSSVNASQGSAADDLPF